MKINSKYVYVFSALFVLAILISSASAAEKLVANDFDNKNFAMDVPSGSDFQKEGVTDLKVGDIAINMLIYENSGNNSDDVNSIIYLKDSSSKQNIIGDAIDDLKKEGVVVEETDKYFVVENKKSGDFLNWDIGNDIDNFFSNIDSFFSGSDVNVSSNDADVNVSSNDADVQVSTADGINIVDNEDNTVSLSGEGFHVSDSNGEDVSISSEGIKVSSSSSSGNGSSKVTEETNVSIDGNMISDMGSGDYSLCIENQDNNQLIILNGNNLELMKSMADTASFSK